MRYGALAVAFLSVVMTLSPSAVGQDQPTGSKMLVVDDLNGDVAAKRGGGGTGKQLELELELKEKDTIRKVSPTFEFETGQMMYVSIKPVEDGELYVLYYDKGQAEKYFPHPQLYNGQASVWKGKTTRLPLQLDGEPGKFTLIAVFVAKDAPEASRRQLFRPDGIDSDHVVRLAGLQTGGKGAVVAPEAMGESYPSPGVTVVKIPIDHAR